MSLSLSESVKGKNIALPRGIKHSADQTTLCVVTIQAFSSQFLQLTTTTNAIFVIGKMTNEGLSAACDQYDDIINLIINFLQSTKYVNKS